MSKQLACVVTVAGTDPSGGAGISADIKTISATGGYAAAIITALVAQNTQGVQAIVPVTKEFVSQQFESIFSDIGVKAVKVGMLQEESMMERVFSELRVRELKNIVFDPVMVAKGGALLLDLKTIDSLKHCIKGLPTLLTPNIVEAEYLLGNTIPTTAAMEAAAKALGDNLQVNVLLKGGHLQTAESSDVLYLKENSICHWVHAPRIDTINTHGTGCSLSSAIASYLAQGYDLIRAVETAKAYLTQAIASGARYSIGQGHGPVDHFYFLDNRYLYSNASLYKTPTT